MNKDEFYLNARNDLTGPMDGVRVLEICSTWAGPMCCNVLADLGADVIKVELPKGEVGRYVIPMLPSTDMGAAFATVNRNKRSLAVDIRIPEGRDICLDVAKQCDIVVQNFKVGTMSGYGLGYEDVLTVKPDVVYVSISGFGQYGPHQDAPAYDPLIQAVSGFMSVNGQPDSPPTKAGIYLTDDLSGLHGALGAIAALRHRDQTGEGQHVDISMLDAMLFQSNGLPLLASLGIEPGRMGNEFGVTAPANVYECKDGPVYLVTLLDSHWEKLAEVIGQPDLGTNEAFATRVARVENRDIVNQLVGGWLAAKTRKEAMDLLSAAGIPIGPVNTYVESVSDSHIQARDMLQEVEFADGTSSHNVGPAAKFSRTPTRVRMAAAALGQHTDEILEDLGLAAEERQRLIDAGIVHRSGD